jgi:hypothetical protein
MTKEERAALILMGADGIRQEIENRKVLLSQMVGTLYPAILRDEIGELQELLERKVTETR